jgi:FAD/FMN-containing dehydrogenase
MIGNNAAGMRSVIHSMTIDYLLALEIILSDGEILKLDTVNDQQLEEKCQQNDREGEIYATVYKLIKQQSAEIKQRYPKVIRRSGGYALDALLDFSQWNLAKLLCGSEGTLGFA